MRTLTLCVHCRGAGLFACFERPEDSDAHKAALVGPGQRSSAAPPGAGATPAQQSRGLTPAQAAAPPPQSTAVNGLHAGDHARVAAAPPPASSGPTDAPHPQAVRAPPLGAGAGSDVHKAVALQGALHTDALGAGSHLPGPASRQILSTPQSPSDPSDERIDGPEPESVSPLIRAEVPHESAPHATGGATQAQVGAQGFNSTQSGRCPFLHGARWQCPHDLAFTLLCMSLGARRWVLFSPPCALQICAGLVVRSVHVCAVTSSALLMDSSDSADLCSHLEYSACVRHAAAAHTHRAASAGTVYSDPFPNYKHGAHPAICKNGCEPMPSASLGETWQQRLRREACEMCDKFGAESGASAQVRCAPLAQPINRWRVTCRLEWASPALQHSHRSVQTGTLRRSLSEAAGLTVAEDPDRGSEAVLIGATCRAGHHHAQAAGPGLHREDGHVRAHCGRAAVGHPRGVAQRVQVCESQVLGRAHLFVSPSPCSPPSEIQTLPCRDCGFRWIESRCLCVRLHAGDHAAGPPARGDPCRDVRGAPSPRPPILLAP